MQSEKETFPTIWCGDTKIFCFLSSILNITEAMGDRIVGYEGSSTLVAPAIGIAVVDVVPGEFNSLMIGVASDATGKKPEVGKISL